MKAREGVRRHQGVRVNPKAFSARPAMAPIGLAACVLEVTPGGHGSDGEPTTDRDGISARKRQRNARNAVALLALADGARRRWNASSGGELHGHSHGVRSARIKGARGRGAEERRKWENECGRAQMPSTSSRASRGGGRMECAHAQRVAATCRPLGHSVELSAGVTLGPFLGQFQFEFGQEPLTTFVVH